jgi:hypothetical protein
VKEVSHFSTMLSSILNILHCYEACACLVAEPVSMSFDLFQFFCDCLLKSEVEIICLIEFSIAPELFFFAEFGDYMFD